MNVFAEQGFAGSKIVDIAKRAGVAKGTVYLYFPTKDALLEAAIRRYITPAFSDLARLASAQDRSATEVLCSVIERTYRELACHPVRRSIMQILIAEGGRFPALARFYHDEVLVGAKEMLRAIVRQGAESGEFRRSLLLENPQVLIGPVILATIWELTFSSIEPLELEAHIAAHLDLVLKGLVNPPGERPSDAAPIRRRS